MAASSPRRCEKYKSIEEKANNAWEDVIACMGNKDFRRVVDDRTSST